MEKRRPAIAEIKAMSGGRFLTTAALERIVDEERESPLGQIGGAAPLTFLSDANVIVHVAAPRT